MKKFLFLFLFSFNLMIFAESLDYKPIQSTCPIMGGIINPDLYVEAEGKRIYVCCKGCIKAVKADPKKAIEKIIANGEIPEKLEKAKY